MPQEQHEFTLDDADDAPHTYLMHELPPKVGMRLCFRLYGALSAPLTRVLGTAVTELEAMMSGASTLKDLLDDPRVIARLTGALKGVDWSALGSDVGAVLRDPNLADDCRELLSTTFRDGTRLTAGGYDLAYQGNYIEHHRAILEAVKYNRFFPGFSTSLSVATSNQSKE
uniref:Uncharacterized protein n=1 Tax=viral metagenome TaxID=1070528 RepID=A0A6M3MCI8_9ZZZZ